MSTGVGGGPARHTGPARHGESSEHHEPDVACAYDPSNWEQRQKDQEFMLILGYIVNLWPVWAT